MAGRIAVVDDRNRFLRWETREAVHRLQLFHRSIHVLVFTSDNRLVVQRRHRLKVTHPGHWDLSCAGHVEESDYPAGPDDDVDEVYRAVARRELQEELGLDVEVERLGGFGPRSGVHYEQIRLFRAHGDGPFVVQEEEVEEVRLVTRPEAERLEPQTATLRYFLGWLDAQGLW
jgi:isopentenyldiphosphate isomerase